MLMRLVAEKQKRTLCLYDGEQLLYAWRMALGRCPEGAKKQEGDGRTPEGRYAICLVKENGKYGRSLGLSYPGTADAQLAFDEGRIDERTLNNIRLASEERRRPPWGSPMGGEIYIHEGGVQSDWTQGCIALESADMDRLFPLRDQIDEVHILP